MTNDQLTDQIISLKSENSEFRASFKSVHKRLDETDNIINGIHEIAASVQTLALHIKLLTERLDENQDKVEESIQRHGERIGAVERVAYTVERLEKSIISLTERVDALEKEPAAKWKDLVKQLITLAVAAAVGALSGRFTK